MNTTNTTFPIGKILLVTLAIFVLGGCSTARPIRTQVDVQLGDEEAYRQFWFHAISSVRHFGYDLDRADPAAGVISSRPLTSKQWFEFWRNDTLAADQVAEASLHTIRRQVRLTVQPTATKGEYLVNAVVNVERQERPEQQVTTPINALQAFNPRVTAARQPPGTIAQTIYWIDLGRDPVLEAALLRQLARWPDARIVIPAENAEVLAPQPADETPAPQTPPAEPQ